MIKKILLILLLFLPLTLAVTYPKVTDFVTDNADMISPEYEAKITQLAEQIEQETTAEVAVVTVNNLEGVSIEQYSTELFEKAGIGKKDKDNGLLILIANQERKYRFEVGYGLEGVITDSNKVNIGLRIIEPNFKQGEFGKGIYESLVLIKGMLEGDQEIISKYQSQYFAPRKISYVKLILFFLFWGFIISGLIGRKHRSGFMFFPIFLPGPRWNGGAGGFGSSGFGGFGGGMSGGGGFGGSW